MIFVYVNKDILIKEETNYNVENVIILVKLAMERKTIIAKLVILTKKEK